MKLPRPLQIDFNPYNLSKEEYEKRQDMAMEKWKQLEKVGCKKRKAAFAMYLREIGLAK